MQPDLTRRGFHVQCWWLTVQNLVLVATWWLHDHTMKKARYRNDSRLSILNLGWLMGLEPTTTGITILDSTN